MGSATGSKWIMILIIYFFLMTILVTIITSISGGNIETDINIASQYCDNPRNIYESYNHDTYTSSSRPSDLWNLDCSKSYGIISENNCLQLTGCNWTSPSLSWWEKLWGSSTPPATCLGTINASHYNILTYTSIFGGLGVRAHNNTEENFMGNYGSICNHPEVIDCQDTCELFSCNWMEKKSIETDLNIDASSNSRSMIRQVWSTIGNMFTFKQTFETNSDYGDFLITIFLFWIPLVALLLAILQLILESTWT